MKVHLKLILLTLILGFCSNSYAQTPINFGFTGGVSQSQYSIGIDSIDTEAVSAWQGGIFARIKIKKVYIGADALLVSNPGKFSSNTGNTQGEISVLGLDVPIVFGWKLIKTKVFNLRLYGGPTMRMNFYEKVKTSFNGSSLETNDNWQFKGGPKWSLIGGFGMDIAFFTVDLRYLYSVSDWSNVSVATVNSNGIQLNIGFKIL